MKYQLLRNECSEDINLIMPDIIRLNVDRQVYEQKDLFKLTDYQTKTFSFSKFLKKQCSWTCPKVLYNVMPTTRWIPSYPWRTDLISDIVAGITVGVITLPQAMAYALIGNTPAVVGLYMAVFPVVVYFLFSTSRHNSMGTFAIVCLMTGRVVAKHAAIETLPRDLENNKTLAEEGKYASSDVAATAAFTVCLFQFAMYLLRLGTLANILSDVLVNGFTSAAACHVLCSQLPNLLGLSRSREKGYFFIPRTVKYIILALPQANRLTLTMSFVAIMIMVLNNEVLKPWIAKYTKIPMPIELVVVILGTITSYFGDLSKTKAVKVVAYIPTGLPFPRLPIFTLIPEIVVDCILITIVSYSISISMATLFAQRSRYNVKPNQELFAMSLANLAGSFFSCLPICASLARTYVQYNTGGKTQISSIIAATLILVILLFMGPLFEPLPRCILASIIVVALKGLLQQAREVPNLMRLNKWDALIWICTFFPTVFVSIDVGLFMGVGVSICILFKRGHRPKTCILGQVPNTELYLDIERHRGVMQVEELEGIKIVRYSGSLNYALKTHFKRMVYEAATLKPSKILRYILNPFTEDDHDHINQKLAKLKCLIIDFSALTYIDPSCIELLETLINEYAYVGVSTYIAACSSVIYESFRNYERNKRTTLPLVTFATVHDAVLYAQKYALINRPGTTVMEDVKIPK